MFITGRPGILKRLIRGFDQAKYEYPPVRITFAIYQVFFQAEKPLPSQVKVMLPQLKVLSLLPTRSGLSVLVEIWKVTQKKCKRCKQQWNTTSETISLIQVNLQGICGNYSSLPEQYIQSTTKKKIYKRRLSTGNKKALQGKLERSTLREPHLQQFLRRDLMPHKKLYKL